MRIDLDFNQMRFRRCNDAYNIMGTYTLHQWEYNIRQRFFVLL